MSDELDDAFLGEEEREQLQNLAVLSSTSDLRNLPYSSFFLLKKVGCKLIFGDVENLMLDAAAYCVLCAKDEALFQRARKLALKSAEDFWLFACDYLDNNYEKVEKSLSEISNQLKAYYASLTKSEVEQDQKKT